MLEYLRMTTGMTALVDAFGNLGSALAGWATVIGFAVAWRLYVRQKRFEKAAEVCEEVWESAARLALALRGLTNPMRIVARKAPDEKLTPGQDRLRSFAGDLELVSDAANRYLDSWNRARLHFEKALEGPLDHLWRLRGDIVAAHQTIPAFLDQGGAGLTPDLDARATGDHRQIEIDEALAWIRTAVSPVVQMKCELPTVGNPPPRERTVQEWFEAFRARGEPEPVHLREVLQRLKPRA